MSQENVEVALAAVEAWNRGDRESWLACWDPDVEFLPMRAQLEGRSYRGHDGLQEFLAEIRDEWDGVRFEIEEARDAGERVVGVGRFHARGKVSGVEIDVPLGIVARVRGDKIFYLRMYSDPAEALEAAGDA